MTAQRWHLIDSLRGVALAGILFVNTLDITKIGYGRAGVDGLPSDPLRDLLYLTVQSRFVPIFACLFGMSIWFVLSGARSRAGRPWLVLVRRLLVLAGIGWLLTLVYPGNILMEYGVVGLLVLPGVLFVPRKVLLLVGALLTLGITALIGSNDVTDIGLMLLGAGAAACGVPAVLERGGRKVVLVLALAVAAAVPLLLWQTTQPGDSRFTAAGPIAGLAMAVVYTTGLAVLWRTPAHRAIAAVFDPLGRMALSNYVGAAILVAASTAVVDWPNMTSVGPAVLLAGAIILVQSLASRLWLRRFTYGPIEWVWRSATWLAVVPLARNPRKPSLIELQSMPSAAISPPAAP